jgi:hypothetical protein
MLTIVAAVVVVLLEGKESVNGSCAFATGIDNNATLLLLLIDIIRKYVMLRFFIFNNFW